MRVNKKEIADLLGKSYGTVKNWSMSKLTEELKRNCWKVVSIKKKGREKIFTLEYQDTDINIVDFVKGEFNVKDGNNFIGYSKERIRQAEDNVPTTRDEICEKTNTNKSTAKRYDGKMIDRDMIKKDGYYYIRINNKTGTRVLVDKVCYDNFWFLNRTLRLEIDNLFDRYVKGEISKRSFEYLLDITKSNANNEYYYYKVRKYLVNDASDLVNIIKAI